MEKSILASFKFQYLMRTKTFVNLDITLNYQMITFPSFTRPISMFVLNFMLLGISTGLSRLARKKI